MTQLGILAFDRSVHPSRRDLVFFALISLAFLLVTWPALSTAFAQNDDYLYFQFDSRARPYFHPQFSFFFLSGRFLYTPIAWAMGTVLWRIADFTWIRALAYLLSLVLGANFFRELRRHRWSPESAAAFVFLFWCLPGFLMHLIWVTMFPFYFAMLLAVWAARRLPLEENSTWRDRLMSLILLQLSLFIYQPGAMLYLLMAALRTLPSAPPAARPWPSILRAGSLFAVACTLYFVVQKFVLLPLLFAVRPVLGAEYAQMGKFQFSIKGDLWSHVWQTLSEAFTNVLNLWNLTASRPLAAGVLSLVALLAALAILRPRKGSRQAAWWTAVPLALVVSLSPSLLAGGHFGFRVLLTATALLLLAIFALARSLPHQPMLAHFARLALCLAVGIAAHHDVQRTVENNVFEFNYIKSALAKLDLEQHPQIDIYTVANDRWLSYFGDYRRGEGEFFYSSATLWTLHAWMIRAALIENGIPRDDLQVINNGTSHSRGTEPPPHPPKYTISVWSEGKSLDGIPPETFTLDFRSVNP